MTEKDARASARAIADFMIVSPQTLFLWPFFLAFSRSMT
jgi:hypothetical protein